MLARIRSPLAILLLLAGICALGWLLIGSHLPDPGLRNVPPTGEDGRKAGDTLALAPFGDNEESYDTIRTFGEVRDLNFLSPAEVATFEVGGATAARVVVASRLPEGKVVALVVRTSSREAATDVADRLARIQLAAGFEPHPDRPGLRRVDLVPGQLSREPRPPLVRVLYVHDDLVLRLELTGHPGADPDAAFDSLLARQLTVLPADG